MTRDWEHDYQNGDTPWDHGCAAPPLLEFLDAGEAAPWKAGPVLVPGCGAGHDVRALVARGIAATGLDIAPTAIALARALPPAAGETYEAGDFMSLAWQAGKRFMGIWEHTCFCAIDPALRPAYAAAAAAVLPPGALYVGVFYLDPDHDRDGPPFGATTAEIDGLFAPFFTRLWGRAPTRFHVGREGREWLAAYRRV